MFMNEVYNPLAWHSTQFSAGALHMSDHLLTNRVISCNLGMMS